jgi:hypothetical protein
MVFSLDAFFLGKKERILIFFQLVLIFTSLGQDITHLPHKENMHTEIFLLGRLKIVIRFSSLTALVFRILYLGDSDMVKKTSHAIVPLRALQGTSGIIHRAYNVQTVRFPRLAYLTHFCSGILLLKNGTVITR